MLTAADYQQARAAYQARLAAMVATMVGILSPTETEIPEKEVMKAAPVRTSTQRKKYRVTRTVSYLEVVDVLADSQVAARVMVESGLGQPRLIRTGATEYTAQERR